MTDRLLVELDTADRDDIVAALRDQADRYRRAGIRAAGEAQHARRAQGKDIRTRAVRVVELLAIADTLTRVAETVEHAAASPPPSPTTGEPADLDESWADRPDPDLDGLTAADIATLEQTPPPAREDAEGSLPEDDTAPSPDDYAAIHDTDTDR